MYDNNEKCVVKKERSPSQNIGLLRMTSLPSNPIIEHQLAEESSTNHPQLGSSSLNEQQKSGADDFTPTGNVTLKITLKSSELVFIENPEDAESFALIARTTLAFVAHNLCEETFGNTDIEIQVSHFMLH